VATTTSAPPPRSSLTKPSSTAIRGDIQGLRALAVSLVLLFHLWPNRLGGGYIGVDVFFVISGFLITAHLLSRPPRNLHGLGDFWSRRIRRLLPASFLVLGVTLLASRLIAPETQWANTARDIRGATMYIVNWRLANNSVDYLAAENLPSPAQHFWSLSVEEQFYLGWPVLILVLVWWAVRRGRDTLTTIMTGLSLVVIASFAWSMWKSIDQPAAGFFVTPTRIWELGVGALLAAFVLRRERAGSGYPANDGPWRVGLTVVGLAAILWAAITYSGSTPFPGWHAAIPVLGSALLIGIGPATRPGGLDRILDNPAAQWLGDISYSVYLWHWPMIVLLPDISGGHLGRLDKLVILATTLVLAHLTKIYVEDRFRRPRATQRRAPRLRPTFALAALGMATLVALSTVQLAEVSQRQEKAQVALQKALSGDATCFAANATVPGSGCELTRSGEVVPAPAQAVDDKADAYGPDCREFAPYPDTASCTYGDPRGDVRVALAGNSHALSWQPPVDRIGKASGWRVTTYFAAGCRLSDARTELSTREHEEGCLAWGKRVGKKLRDGNFDLVVMVNSTGPLTEDGNESPTMRYWERGHRSFLERLTANGGPRVVVIHDTPDPDLKPPVPIPDCVAKHRDDLLACSGSRSAWAMDDPMVDAARGMRSANVSVADLTDHLCFETRCPTVIGGVIVYFDTHHLTRTYSRSLARFLEPHLTRALRSTG
jgi:peptidoglycan/LPS O-acetylase OafA/YrhL